MDNNARRDMSFISDMATMSSPHAPPDGAVVKELYENNSTSNEIPSEMPGDSQGSANRFGKQWQLGLLSALLADPKFFSDVAASLNKNLFGTEPLRLSYEVAVTLYYENPEHKLPSWNVFQQELNTVLEDTDDGKYRTRIGKEQYDALYDVLLKVKESLDNPSEKDSDYYRKDLGEFIRVAMYRNINPHEMTPDERIAYAHKVEEASNSVSASQCDIYSLDDIDGMMSDQTDDVCRIGTGIRGIDELTNSGLRPGETGLIMAGSGVGKTTAMLNFAVNNAKLGHNVLFMTLENSKPMIQERIYSIMGNVPARQLKLPSDMREPYVVDAIRHVAKSVDLQRIKVADMTRQKPTCDAIESMIAKWQRMISGRMSTGACQVVYVDWLEEIDQSGLGIERSANSDIIWQRVMSRLCQIARNKGIVLWTAQQINRQAKNKEILTQADIAHSSSVFNPIDLGLGLANVKSRQMPSTRRQFGMSSSGGDGAVTSDTDRMMRVSFTKSRESSAVGKTVVLYQGPSLKLWDDKSMCIKVMRDVKNGKWDLLGS